MASILERVSSPWRGRRDPNQDLPEPQQPAPVEEEVFIEMTLQEHLEELRTRILYSVIAILIAFVAGVVFSGTVLRTIADQANVPDEQMQVISPTEGFVIYFKVALYIAVAIAMPVLVYQFLRFLAPGLTRRERHYVHLAVPFVMLSFLSGVAFAFFVLAPRALDFLSTFGSSYFQWNPRAEELISFYLTLMLGVGLIFELPILMYALALIGAMTAKRYGRFRKYALILSMALSAFITPTPDPFNMMLLALPTYLLYEVGTLLSRTVKRTTRD